MKEKMIQEPDYNHSIVSLANSIRKEFNIPVYHDTLKEADVLLKEDYKNVIVMLLDGFGINILRKHCAQTGLFSRHLVTSYSSTFPPTTVASTTSIDSGLYPSEHGWLGWTMYFEELDKNVVTFLNTEDGTNKPAAPYDAAKTILSYKPIVEEIKEAGGHAYFVTPFHRPFYQTFDDQQEYLLSLCQKNEKKYIYFYTPEPDSTMHEYGIEDKRTHSIVHALEKQINDLYTALRRLYKNGEIEKTLLLITADHGHVNSRSDSISNYPKLLECLKRLPSIEPRALNLFVKEDMKEQFEIEWAKHFADDFILLTHDEVINRQLFGPTTQEARYQKRLGDYLAIAVNDLSIFNNPEDSLSGVHAGLTQEELTIPLFSFQIK